MLLNGDQFSMRILLIDDDEQLMEALANKLIEQRYAVDIANTGEMGWEFILLFSFDLVVLDWMLPDIDGIELCQQIRTEGYTMPVLLLTARDRQHDKVSGLDAGADDYVVKPFDFDELTARIRALLRREINVASPILKWQNLSLNPKTHEVYHQQQLLPLTPKEYGMIELFMRHPQQVFSPDAIINNLWAGEDPPGGEAVRTHIKGLRQKLKAVGMAKDTIKTVYGVGYRLKSDDDLTKSDKSQANNSSHRSSHAPKKAGKVVEDKDMSAGHPPRTQQSDSALQTTDTCGQDFSAMTVSQPEKSAAIDSLNASSTEHVDKYIGASPLLARQGTVNQIWLRFKDQAFQRLADLENLVVASSKNSLTNELYQQALSSAHKLAGSLGCFGFPEGSRLAKQIELLLTGNPVEKVDIEQIFKLTASLNTELQRKPFEETVKDALSKNISILIVDRSHDLDLDRQLIIEAHNSGMKTQLATDLTHAQTILETELIDALLHKIVFPDGEDLEFLDKLHQLKPNLPFVAIAESPRLLDRLHFASTGGSLILQYPVAPMAAITAISELLANLGNTAKVLIIDDDPQVLLSLEMSLKPWGFEVTTLDQPIQFWSVLESVEPDILVLDIDMPEINGIELCQILRSDRYWRHLPVLFLSVHHDEQTQNQAFKIGADDYVCKPVTGSVLANRLLNRLKRSRS